MAPSPRAMRLTPAHVALMQPAVIDEAIPPPTDGYRLSGDDDHRETAAALLARHPDPDEVWLFAYGSLIWRPACEVVETRTGTLRGWHRRFCLGWLTAWRGSEADPGLMLALDRGGATRGVLCRLPARELEHSLMSLFRREMPFRPADMQVRMVVVMSEAGPVPALTFCMDRRSPRYVGGLDEDTVADALARATGARGSMAEYLYETVRHLDEIGIHDRHLWSLQEKVAARIEAAHGMGRQDSIIRHHPDLTRP